jgi:dTDP-4-amino-4,6-dideoxygalactose transaminase
MSSPKIEVPFLRLNEDHKLNEQLANCCKRVIDSGHYILGPEVLNFESQFGKFCGTKFCLSISNGLDALFLALKALDVKPGDEVIVPANTFIATWLATSHVGAKIVPVDAELSSGQMDPALLEIALKSHKNVKCVILVHLYGIVGQIEKIKNLCEKHRVDLIEDAAQAHGTVVNGVKAGAWGDAAIFSFYPGKTLGAVGDGGALVTSRPEVFESVKMLRNYGSQKKYYHEVIGYNHRMDEMQAAILSEKLQHLDSWNQIRAEQVSIYIKAFTEISQLGTFKSEADFTAWHLFVVRTEKREGLRSFLQEQGIETLIHYPVACHLSEAYENLNLKVGSFPVAEEIARTCLSLPLGPHLKASQIEYVADKVREFFAAN